MAWSWPRRGVTRILLCDSRQAGQRLCTDTNSSNGFARRFPRTVASRKSPHARGRARGTEKS